MAPQTNPERVSQRLKDQFSPAYLTLTSIIQGVALSALVVRVESTYPQFSATNWVMTIATFLTILTVWNEYVMQVMAFVWAPTLIDSIVPFAFLAVELFAVHFVYNDLRLWLLTAVIIFLVGGAAQIVTAIQSRQFAADNREIAALLAPPGRTRAIMSAGFIVVNVALWALYDVLHIADVSAFIASLELLIVLAFIGSSVPYWNRVLGYARVGVPS